MEHLHPWRQTLLRALETSATDQTPVEIILANHERLTGEVAAVDDDWLGVVVRPYGVPEGQEHVRFVRRSEVVGVTVRRGTLVVRDGSE